MANGKVYRECDEYIDPPRLHKAFAEYCNECERNCPMGCEHRKQIGMAQIGKTTPLELMLDYRCASILSCFARFVLSDHVEKLN